MKRLKKGALYYINSWQHFGTRMIISKAWEKFVVDRYRFRPNLIRTVPTFLDTYRDSAIPALASTRPLTICYLLHYFFPDKQGGTERFILNLAKEQQKLGNHVRVITLGKRRKSQYPYRTGHILWCEFEYDGIPVTQFRYNRAPRGLYYDAIRPDDHSMQGYAHAMIKRYHPDVIHMAYPQPFAAFSKVCREMGIPYILTLTDFNIFCHYATMVKKNGQFCGGSCQGRNCRTCKTYGVKDACDRYQKSYSFVQCASMITCPSRFVANIMQQEFPSITIHVVPHGIGRQFYTSVSRKRTKRFLYAGTLSHLKGIHLLIEAFINTPGDISLAIYGGGDPAYVRALKAQAHKDTRIMFGGEISAGKMPDVYCQADCVVVPSMWYETYNFVLRESLACGCLGIASNMGAMPEALVEGQNGFLFEAGDVASLEAALQRALQFDWDKYQPTSFPLLEQEAVVYQNLYHAISEEQYDSQD